MGGVPASSPAEKVKTRVGKASKARDKYYIDLLSTAQKGLPVKSHRNSLIRHRFLIDILFILQGGLSVLYTTE